MLAVLIQNAFFGMATTYTSPTCCSHSLDYNATKDSYHLQSYLDHNLLVLGKKYKGPIRLQGCEMQSFHWMRETV